MNKYEKSAIIGYYRSGATDQEIAAIMYITVKEVRKIIDTYLIISQ